MGSPPNERNLRKIKLVLRARRKAECFGMKMTIDLLEAGV